MANLDPELKAKWVSALRSGEYQQCAEYLHKDGRYCCLGVLAVVIGHPVSDIDNRGVLDFVDSELANRLEDYPARTNKVALEAMNDGTNEVRRHSFQEIAEWIEFNL